MDNPERVNRVRPPTNTMMPINPKTATSQYPTALVAVNSVLPSTVECAFTTVLISMGDPLAGSPFAQSSIRVSAALGRRL